MTAKKKSFIVTTLKTRGITPREQDEGGVGRRITEFWSDEGILILEYDPYTKKCQVYREDLLS